jgi:hypothetical protein
MVGLNSDIKANVFRLPGTPDTDQELRAMRWRIAIREAKHDDRLRRNLPRARGDRHG